MGSGIPEAKAPVLVRRCDVGPGSVEAEGVEGGDIEWGGDASGAAGLEAPHPDAVALGGAMGEGGFMRLRVVADLCAAVADLIAASPKVAAFTARKLGRLLAVQARREERDEQRRSAAYEKRELAAVAAGRRR